MAENDLAPGGTQEEILSVLDRLAREMQPEGAGDSDDTADAGAIAKVLLSESYRGAFPHPDVLLAIDACVSDGAERAFSLTEREQKHRHECDAKLIDAQVRLIDAQVRRADAEARDRRLALLLGFFFLVLAAAGAFIAVITGHPAGVAVGGTGLLAFIGVLIRAFGSRNGVEGNGGK